MNEKEYITKWKDKIGKELMKSFPADFIEDNEVFELELPGKSLMLSELFNSYEIIDADGNTYFTTDDYLKAKYILYATRLRPKQIVIPKNNDNIKAAVKNYEKYLDSLLKEMETDYKKEFPEAVSFLKVSNIIFNSLNLQRY